MRFTVLLLACVLAATAAHSHEEIELPELPIPEIDQLFPVDSVEAAFRWAGHDFWGDPDRLRWRQEVNWEGDNVEFNYGGVTSLTPNRFVVVSLSEGQFGRLGALLAGIQEPLSTDENEFTDRFAVYMEGWSQGGLTFPYEFLWTWGAGRRSKGYDYEYASSHLLRTRFSVAGGSWARDTALRDTEMSMRFRFVLLDYDGWESHTSHSNGSPRHNLQRHSLPPKRGPFTDWLPVADLLDGNVAPPPAAPEQPADNEDAPEDDASNEDALAQLRAELDALRGNLSAVRGDLAAVRDSVAWLSDIDLDGLGSDTIIRVDTVEVARVDTVHFCPPTDEDRQALFDAFTGVNEDSTNSGGAGKAAAVRPSSWGAIKALMQE